MRRHPDAGPAGPDPEGPDPMAARRIPAAAMVLRTLRANGVAWFLGNPGTDFAPVVESYARAAADGGDADLPRPVLVAHETTAVSMAHGIWLATGHPAATMVHVNVGLANALCNLMNASRDRVPLVMMSGRTPVTQQGRPGSRSGYIHWGQEMFDQGAILRELVRWDYEMRLAEQAGPMTARAIEIACSEPTGPVYLSLPREVLAEEVPPQVPPAACPTDPPRCDPAALGWLADCLASARRPVILTSAAGRDPDAVAALADLATAAGVPVVECTPRYLNMPRSHAWHGGYDPDPWLAQADLVLVVECEVPWFPARSAPQPAATVVHLAVDPVFAAYPMRDFPGHRNIAGAVAPALRDLARLLADRRLPDCAPPARGRRTLPNPLPGAPLTFDEASAALATLTDDRTVIFNEYPLRPGLCPVDRPGSYFALSPAGGLGWALGAALGYRLARDDRLVIAALGDGAYLYSNPEAALLTARTEGLAILIVLFNNNGYGGVRRATLSMYPQGAAAQDQGRLLADFSGAPDYAELARVQGAHGETVTDRAALVPALIRARDAVLAGQLALVNVVMPE